MTAPDVVFRDLPAAAFPFTIELLSTVTRDVVWTTTITSPGVLRIPGLNETGPDLKAVRITFADGTVQEMDPDGEEQAG